MRDHPLELLDALRARGDLRAQVGEVLVDVARRISARAEDRAHLVLEKAPLRDQLHVVEQHALLVDVRRIRRHRARRDAADVGVMAARRDVELRANGVCSALGIGRLVEKHRRDHRDVGQMRAAVVRRIEHEHVAGLHRAGAAVDDRLHALAHRAQVHRHVRRIGDQVAFGVEQRAREIEPLLDVDRVRGVGERHAHLLGDRHEQVVEHLEQHRVGAGADRMRARDRDRRARAPGDRAR